MKQIKKNKRKQKEKSERKVNEGEKSIRKRK